MSNNAPSGDSLTHKLAKLRSAAEAIERLAADYHSARQPVRESLQAVADVPLEHRDRWAEAASALARRLSENGMADVPASLEGVERWDRQFDAGSAGRAFAGRAFCTALAAAIANGSPPSGFFATLDQHSFITTTAATREVCAVLSQLLYVHTERIAPGFTRGYGAILAEVGTDSETLRHRLAQCGMPLSSDAAAAIHDWGECSSGIPFYHVDICPAPDCATADGMTERSEGGSPEAESRSHRELRECVPLVENPRPYQPNPPPPETNPYLTLRHVLHELFCLAALTRQGQDVFRHINPTTDPWDEAEARARGCSAGWGIPFATFDPILTDAKRTMRELAQVAAGNVSVAFSVADSRYAMLEERLQELANSVPLPAAGDATPADAGGPVQRFRCYNCTPPHEFSLGVPVCPQCSADARKPREQQLIVPLVTIHFDPPHPVIRGEGQRVMACTGESWPPGTVVSGETSVVTCPACRETEAFKPASIEQHPLDATDRGRKRVDDLVAQLCVDPPPGLDPELAAAFSTVATGVRECTRLMGSVPHLRTDEEEYRRLAACVADATTTARAAHMAVDIRLRRAGGPNPMLDALNDVLTVQGRAPLDPTGTPNGLDGILTNLHMKRTELFRTVDGRGCIDRMLDQLARVPSATNTPAAANPLPAVPPSLSTGTKPGEGGAPKPTADVPLPPGTIATEQGMLAHLDALAATNTTVRSWVVDLGAKHAGAGGGEEGKPTDSILPAMLSAHDIAKRIGRNPKSVTSFLTRFAEKKPDCRFETGSKRKNEPVYLYRTADVWPALEQWMKDNKPN